MKSDIEIARSIELKEINQVAQDINIPLDRINNYGRNIAKVDEKLIDEEKVAKNNKDFVEFCKAIGVQDGKIKIDGIECWIKKVSVNISKSYTFLVE